MHMVGQRYGELGRPNSADTSTASPGLRGVIGGSWTVGGFSGVIVRPHDALHFIHRCYRGRLVLKRNPPQVEESLLSSGTLPPPTTNRASPP
jgi:hypothetical protein